MTPLEVTEQFVAAINAHEIERLAALMTAEHRFIDSLDGRIAEWQVYADNEPMREQMRAASA